MNYKEFSKKIAELKPLIENKPIEDNFGLLYGVTGQLLTLNELGMNDSVNDFIDLINEAINNDYFGGYDFGYGLSGSFSYLIDIKILDKSIILPFIDNVEKMIKNIPDELFLFDPFQGVLGYYQLFRSIGALTEDHVLYFLEKLETFKTKYGFYADNIEHPMYKLKDSIEYDVFCNLGLAHGNGAILYWLYYFENSFDLEEVVKYRVALEGAYLELIKNYPNGIPGVISKKGKFEETNFGWCYGELPIIVIILNNNPNDRYRKVLKNHVENICMEIEKAYKPLMIDFSICHGIPGICYMLSKINIHVQSDIVSHSLRKFYDLLIGFDVENTPQDKSFLNGICGYSLVLNSIIKNKYENQWDKYLLLN